MSGVAELLMVVERSEVGVKGGVFGAGEQPAWCFQSRYLRSVISFSSQMRPAASGAHVPEAPSSLSYVWFPSVGVYKVTPRSCHRFEQAFYTYDT